MFPSRYINISSEDGKQLFTRAMSAQPPSANGTENWESEIPSLLYSPALSGHGLG